MNPKVLVEVFAEHVAAQTDAIFRGDAKTGTKHARRYLTAVDKLLALGDAGRMRWHRCFLTLAWMSGSRPQRTCFAIEHPKPKQCWRKLPEARA